MLVELSPDEVEILLTSLEFSKKNVREAEGTPYEVRQQNLGGLDAVAGKLRDAKKVSAEE